MKIRGECSYSVLTSGFTHVHMANNQPPGCPFTVANDTLEHNRRHAEYSVVMTTAGGGTVAAYGLRYQYLSTIEHFLYHLRNNLEVLPRTSLLVEPVIVNPDGSSDDIVDYGFLTDDAHSHHYQVKSSLTPDQYPLTPSLAREVLDALHAHPAPEAALHTNKPLSPTLKDAVTRDTTRSLPQGVHAYRWPPSNDANADTSYPIVLVDDRDEEAIRASICALIREFRRDRQLSQGEFTCNALVSVLLDRVFSAAASATDQRIDALDLIELLAMPDARIAQIAGGFDWGRVTARIPHYASTIPRIGYLEQIHNNLASDASMSPPRIALVGHTGAGKSVVASDFCHIDANSFAFICWIDCRDTGYVDTQALDVIVQLSNGAAVADSDVAAVFARVLGDHPGPWLLVLDGVENRAQIELYLPTRGHGTILITSTNALNWWPGTTVIEVGEFALPESISCFRVYSGLGDQAADDIVAEIVNSLENVPLAVSMAGIYFANADGDVAELSKEYFADLAALDDTLSIPPGFNQTAFKAIRYAVKKLGTRDPNGYGTRARALLEMGSLLAPEQIPLNLIVPATSADTMVNVARPPQPAEIDAAVRRGVMAALRTQSVANRVLRAGESTSPTDETINIHPLIHQILQTSRLNELPPGQLQMDATVFMHFLRGWLGSLRNKGDFLGTDQIRMHAEALLDVIDEYEPLTTYGPNNQRVYLYTKAFLLAELSVAQASRLRSRRSMELAQAAGQILAQVGNETAAQSVQVMLLVNMVHDLAFMNATPALLQRFAMLALSGIEKLVNDSKLSSQDVGYTYAGELHLWLRRTDDYRSAPELIALTDALTLIINTDPRKAERPAATNNKINDLY